MKVKKRVIEEQWLEFRKRVLDPIRPEEIQLTETRRAFYAGANGLYAAIMNILEPGTEATDKDLEVMAGIHQEFIDFAEEMKKGKA
jgi:hypothetical protein